MGVMDEDAVEQDLITAIVERHDEASRQIYADWLESRGDLVRAEFLRLQESLVDARPDQPDFTARTKRLRELATTIDVQWRYDMARAPVEGCKDARFTFQCPRHWSSLEISDRADVRHCSTCNEEVHYCRDVVKARELTRKGRCVVVDIVPVRHPYDLQPPPRLGGVMVMPRMPANPPPPRLPVPPPPPPRPEPDDDETAITGEFPIAE